MKNRLVLRGIDLIKGATKKGKDFTSSLIYDAMPWQMVELEDKTSEWKKWCADYFEWVGMRQMKDKGKKVIKNRMLASGILDMEDYIIGGDDSHTYLNNMFMEQEFIDPLKKFYPLIPPFINVLKGDFIKRNRQAYVYCIDRYTEDQKLEYKMTLVNDILIKDALGKKEKALIESGLSPMSEEQMQNLSPEEQQQAQQGNQQFQQEMDTERQLVESQQKFKKYRHVMEDFGQLVFNKDYDRFNMAELEEEAFVEMLCNSEIAFVLEMMETDYKVKFLDNAKTFHHMSPDLTYYSEGDYFGWFEEVTIGDIINADGKNLSDTDYEMLEEVSEQFYGFRDANINPTLLTDMDKSYDNPYYDARKKHPKGNVDIAKSQYVQNEIIKDIVESVQSNTQMPVSDLVTKSNLTDYGKGKPKMFRKMSLFFKSQRKIGWLTKKDRNGYIVTGQPLWVDENFKVTEKPVYDNSLTKENTSENLIYGEHIDWEWVNEWRFIKKYSPNYSNTSWQNNELLDQVCIYIGGDPIISPFKSTEKNAITVEPPFEGRQFKMKGIRAVSMVESLSPFQILTNICINRIPDIIADDIGLALWINQNTIQNTNTFGIESDGDPLENALENLRKHKVLTTKIDKDLIQSIGNSAPVAPQVLNLSRIAETESYIQLALALKEMAGDTIGVSRQRLAQSKASESATQTQQGINFSEVQTEPLFHQFIVRFMPRVYQKMIEAGTYYATKFESAREFYHVPEEGNAYLSVEDLENPMRQYSVKVQADSKSRELKQKLEQLFFNNNTTESSMLDLAQGLVEESPSEILENLRKAQIKREEAEERKHQQQMELQQQAEEAAKARQELLHQQEIELQQLINQKDENVATIRALGGINTDADADGELDAMQNLQNRIGELQGRITSNAEKLAFDKKKHQDELDMKNKELLSKQAIAQKTLAVSIVNQQSADNAKLNAKVAKKQGVS